MKSILKISVSLAVLAMLFSSILSQPPSAGEASWSLPDLEGWFQEDNLLRAVGNDGSLTVRGAGSCSNVGIPPVSRVKGDPAKEFVLNEIEPLLAKSELGGIFTDWSASLIIDDKARACEAIVQIPGPGGVMEKDGVVRIARVFYDPARRALVGKWDYSGYLRNWAKIDLNITAGEILAHLP